MKFSKSNRDNSFKVALSTVLLVALLVSIFICPRLGITSSVGIIGIWVALSLATFGVIVLILKLIHKRK